MERQDQAVVQGLLTVHILVALVEAQLPLLAPAQCASLLKAVHTQRVLLKLQGRRFLQPQGQLLGLFQQV
jgi:hypothetical protein